MQKAQEAALQKAMAEFPATVPGAPAPPPVRGGLTLPPPTANRVLSETRFSLGCTPLLAKYQEEKPHVSGREGQKWQGNTCQDGCSSLGPSEFQTRLVFTGGRWVFDE